MSGNSTTINVNLTGSGNLSLVLTQAGAAAGHAGRQVDTAGDRVRRFGERAERMSVGVMKTTGKIAGFATASVGAAHGVTVLAAAAVQMSGAIAVVPAVVAAAGIAAGTAKLAVGGLSDAFEASAGDAAAYQESLDKLAPSAQKLVKTAVGLKPALLGVRQSAQGAFFRQWQKDVQPLADKWLPMLRVSLSRVADGQGEAVSGVTKWLRTAGPLNQVRKVIDETGIATHNLSGGLQPVVAGLLNIVTLGSSRLPGMTRNVDGLAKRFERWTNSIGDSGKFDAWVDNAVDGFHQFTALGGNVARIISGIFGAAKGTGGTGLDTLGGSLERVADAVNTPAFQHGLTTVFTAFASSARDVNEQIPHVAEAVSGLAPTFAAIVSGSGAAFGATLKTIADLAIKFAPVINGIATGLEPLAPILGAIVPYLFLAGKGLRLLGLAMNLSPIGLLVTGIALLATGLVLLYQKSEKARMIMVTAFAGIGLGILTLTGYVLQGTKGIVKSFFWMADKILGAANFAFGWVPGIGDKLKTAQEGVKKFGDGIDDTFDAAIKQTDEWKQNLENMPKEVKFKGDIQNLKDKINAAKEKLKTLPPEKQAKVKADIKQLQEKLRQAKQSLAQVKGKTVTLTVRIRDLDQRGISKGIYEHLGGGATLRAAGGRITGPGTSTSDSIPLWGSNGEYMLSAKTVARMGGFGAIDTFVKQLDRPASTPVAAAPVRAAAPSRGGGVTVMQQITVQVTPTITATSQDIIRVVVPALQEAAQNGTGQKIPRSLIGP